MTRDWYLTCDKLSPRNRVMNSCHKFLDMAKRCKDTCSCMELTFVCVKSPRYSFSNFWKVFTVYNGTIIDVSIEISIILDIPSYNNGIIKTSSYGVNIQDDICRRLEIVFKGIFKDGMRFSYKYYDACC